MDIKLALHVSAALFAIGVFGVLSRRNLLIILMSVELMLNGANLALVAVSRDLAVVNGPAAESGQAIVLFSMAVAAAEVAVGLSILIALFRHARSVDTASPRATALRR
ncbi:MAG: NADH-quinone oxidoreductase subunit NuoK [Planctomycetota bacterium]